jgi:hypothetical protein
MSVHELEVVALVGVADCIKFMFYSSAPFFIKGLDRNAQKPFCIPEEKPKA